MRKLLEQAFIKKVNGDDAGAKELFDKFIVERSSVIYGKIRNLQDVELNENFLEELYSRDIYEEDEEEISDDFMSDDNEQDESEDDTDVSSDDTQEDVDIDDVDMTGFEDEDEDEDEANETGDVDLSSLQNDVSEIKDMLNDLVSSFDETDENEDDDLADLAQNSDDEELEVDAEVKESDYTDEDDLDTVVENYLREFEEFSLPKNEEGLMSDGKKLKIDVKSNTLPHYNTNDRMGGKAITIKGTKTEPTVEKPKGSFNSTSTNTKPTMYKAKGPVTTDKDGISSNGSKITGGPTNKGPIAGK
jgi:hypothetical protein